MVTELKSTDFNCANSKVRLSCDPGTAVFVSRVVHKHSATQCVEYDANMNLVHKFKPQAPLDHCLGIDFHDERILKECNGKENCDVEIHKKSHLIGFYGTNCDFQSNIAKIFYTCVPSKSSGDLWKQSQQWAEVFMGFPYFCRYAAQLGQSVRHLRKEWT